MDVGAVRRALRAHLEALGYDVASDSHGLRSELYIMGEGDLARALFEFKKNAAEACDTMYQGSWIAGLPPRFAVMPQAESQSAEVELLEQVGVVPLYFSTDGGSVEFGQLDSILAEHVEG